MIFLHVLKIVLVVYISDRVSIKNCKIEVLVLENVNLSIPNMIIQSTENKPPMHKKEYHALTLTFTLNRYKIQLTFQTKFD